MIKLSSGESVIVDAEDYRFLRRFKWHKQHSLGYAATSVPSGKQKKGVRRARFSVSMPHLIMGFRLRYIDHINGNPLDNRKANLRSATHQQNLWNRGMSSNNRSGYRGVAVVDRQTKKGPNRFFHSVIGYNGKYHFLGSFLTAKEAAIAYNKSAKKFYGKFARLNSI